MKLTYLLLHVVERELMQVGAEYPFFTLLE